MDIFSVSLQKAPSSNSRVFQPSLSEMNRDPEVVSTVAAAWFPQEVDDFQNHTSNLSDRSVETRRKSDEKSSICSVDETPYEPESKPKPLFTLTPELHDKILSFLGLDDQLSATSFCRQMWKFRSDESLWKRNIRMQLQPEREEELFGALSTTMKPGRGIALDLFYLVLIRKKLGNFLRANPDAARQINSLTMDIRSFTEADFACFEHLITLNTLSVTASDPSSLQSLADCEHLHFLTTLSLYCNNIGADGATVVANSAQLSNLTNLDLSYNDIAFSGAVSIAGSAHLSNLTSLDLGGNRIGGAGAESLADSAYLSHLTMLDLSGNHIGAAGTGSIAESAYLSNLTSLDLSSNYIGADEAKALANSKHLSNLTILNLSCNDIGAAGAGSIAGSAQLSYLTNLDLSDNDISVAGARSIADSAYLSNLISLSLLNNGIGDHGAGLIANSEHLSNLTSLDLSWNNIDAAGAASIAHSAYLCRLTSLDLSYNDIANDSKELLLHSLPGVNIVF